LDDALLRQDVVMKTTRGGVETMTDDGAQFPLLPRGESPRTMDETLSKDSRGIFVARSFRFSTTRRARSSEPAHPSCFPKCCLVRPWAVVVIIARRAVGFFAILARDGLLELQTGRAVRLR
jgi:hypothetical protein